MAALNPMCRPPFLLESKMKTDFSPFISPIGSSARACE